MYFQSACTLNGRDGNKSRRHGSIFMLCLLADSLRFPPLTICWAPSQSPEQLYGWYLTDSLSVHGHPIRDYSSPTDVRKRLPRINPKRKRRQTVTTPCLTHRVTLWTGVIRANSSLQVVTSTRNAIIPHETPFHTGTNNSETSIRFPR